MSARQLQDLLSSVVKLPAAAGHSAAVSSAPSASATSLNLAARRSPTVSAFGCSDRRCHLSRHRHRHNSSSSDLVYFSPAGGGGGGGGAGTGAGARAGAGRRAACAFMLSFDVSRDTRPASTHVYGSHVSDV